MAEVLTLPPKNREKDFDRLLVKAATFQPGRPINIKFSIARPERTPDQLKYLWGVVLPLIADAIGYEKEEVHEHFCGEFWGWVKRKKINGEEVSEPIRTTTVDADGNRDVIDGEEFWRYVEFIQRFGARAGVVIPDPDPNYKISGRAR